MNKIHYTGKFFRDSMPEWKRRKDCALARYSFRPWSFYISAWCANRGISANTVSYWSVIVAVLGAVSYLIDNYWFQVTGAILFNAWYLLDCVDGNLARSVRKQPFGDFADSMSSYSLVALMGAPIGYAVYCDGGVIVQSGWAMAIVLGAFASSGDTLMRLVYQKYKSSERNLQDQNVLEVEYDKRLDENQSASMLVNLEQSLGIGGYLCLIILLCTLFRALDLVIAYIFLYYVSSCIAMLMKYSHKAIIAAKKYGDRMPQ